MRGTISIYFMGERAWSSGRVLDCRPDGRGFEPHQRHLPCSRPICCLVMGTWDKTWGWWRWLVWFMTTSLVFALQHQSRQRDYLCHYGVGTDVASVKAEKLLWHLGDVPPPPKKRVCYIQKSLHVKCTVGIHTYAFFNQAQGIKRKEVQECGTRHKQNNNRWRENRKAGHLATRRP